MTDDDIARELATEEHHQHRDVIHPPEHCPTCRDTHRKHVQDTCPHPETIDIKTLAGVLVRRPCTTCGKTLNLGS